MKHVIIVILAFLFTTTQAQDFETFETGVLEPSDIHFINNTTGFISSQGGISITRNAGVDWSYHFGPVSWNDTTMGFYDMDFTLNQTAYAVGWRGTPINDTVWEFNNLIIKSTNNGESWFDVSVMHMGFFPPDYMSKIKKNVSNRDNNTYVLFSVICADPEHVVAAGNYSKVFKTSNGGATWQEYSTGWNSIHTMTYHDNALWGGEWDALFKSTDNGESWIRSSNISMTTSTNCLTKVGTKMFIGGYDQGGWNNISVSHSYDGINWTSEVLPYPGFISDIEFIDNNTGYATGDNPMVLGDTIRPKGYIFKTTDQGNSWTKVFEQEWMQMAAACQTQEYVFFVGMTRLKRLPLQMVSVGSEGIHTNHYTLSQNYPNPFNPTTTINFTLEKQGAVKLELFDITGKHVKTIVNEIKNSGSYSVNFDGSTFSTGTYFYKLEVDGYSEIKKMMLIK